MQRVVYAETSSGQPTFINLPDNVTCLIWGRNRAKWQPVPEVQYTGKRVRCQGEVQLFRGNPQIELMVPDQISVVG